MAAAVRASIIWRGELDRGRALLAAISPDDPDDFHVELVEDGELYQLRIALSSKGLSQSRTTVDDILACLAAAESGLDSMG
ncbi:MAG: KEOPS complex subunit Pcc1 [Candidatus Thalassarchaeaceae archaeon]|jgi:hypothetical protein|nr:hypothetical protein [Euryarchaeota archaeon]MDP6212121.1 KEOPS complex subunit Pcc1 [Candidatus Thalassarchaeaceae archaeon]|tara:strand:- start:157 stop:399 length:243 start_codon:yes stop_codon:yes gene_type:complete